MSPHVTPDEFRRHGGAVIEWIARYMEQIEDFPVRSRVARARSARVSPGIRPRASREEV